MGAQKYGEELRSDIRAAHAAGNSYKKLSEMFGIHIKSIEYIIVNEKGAGTRNYLGHSKRNDSTYVDQKFKDAKAFKKWHDAVIRKLKAERVFKDQVVIHVGPCDFTYRSKKGYNVTLNYVDLYNKRKGVKNGCDCKG